jgi:outer membrane protein assembly factor BamB
MSRAQNQIQSRVIRWALIVGAALVIIGVNVNNLREHLFSTGPIVPGQASREKSATIAEKWQFTQLGPVSAALALAQDGTIYVVNDAGLFAVSAQGKLLAQTAVGGSVDSSPTIAPDGTVYVAARAGKIVAFSGTHGGLLNGAWPKFQAGPANSGRAREF